MIDLQFEIGLAAVACAIVVLGFIRIWRTLCRIVGYEEFAQDFRSRFIEYMNSRCGDQQAYDWLITNSQRMQSEMGSYGLVHAFHPPYEQVIYRDWPIILNALPTIRRMAGDNDSGLWDRLLREYGHLVNDALMRYLGSLDEAVQTRRAAVLNPIAWLSEGTGTLLAIPFYVLSWFGILGSAKVSRITGSHTFKVMSGVVSVASVVGGICGLIVDGPEVWSKISPWLDVWLAPGSLADHS